MVAVHKRNAVYLNQSHCCFRTTASANIAYGLEVRGVPASDIRRQTEQMLAELGLEDQVTNVRISCQEASGSGSVLAGHDHTPAVLLLMSPLVIWIRTPENKCRNYLCD